MWFAVFITLSGAAVMAALAAGCGVFGAKAKIKLCLIVTAFAVIISILIDLIRPQKKNAFKL